jgi:hypothetical protein
VRFRWSSEKHRRISGWLSGRDRQYGAVLYEKVMARKGGRKARGRTSRYGAADADDREEMTMNRTLILTALGLVIALGSTSGAFASGKKPAAHQAATATADPRTMNGAGNHQGWCAVDASCNGWHAWLDDVHAGKLKDEGYKASP